MDARGRDELPWLVAVLDLLPVAAILIERGSPRPASMNAAALKLLPEGDASCCGPAGEPAAPGKTPLARVARGEWLDGEEFCCLTHEGVRTIAAYSAPLPDGPRPLSLLTLLDITKLRASEADLRREIAARDELFAVAAHELKDPLVSLQLSLQLMLQIATEDSEASASDLLDYLQISRRQSERLGRLMGNLLDLSRVAHHRLQIDREAVDLSGVVRDVAAQFREKARAVGSPLDVEAPGPVIGYFDRTKVEQAIANLVANAIKYGGGRPIALRVSGDSETATIDVEDQGAGVAPEDQERIFRRFTRASGDHRRDSLGLGLYITKALAEAHGGTVRVRSAAGKGSVFSLELPLKRLPGRDNPKEFDPGFRD